MPKKVTAKKATKPKPKDRIYRVTIAPHCPLQGRGVVPGKIVRVWGKDVQTVPISELRSETHILDTYHSTYIVDTALIIDILDESALVSEVTIEDEKKPAKKLAAVAELKAE